MTRPFSIWVTVVIAALLSVAAVVGLLKVVMQVPLWLASGSGVALWRIALLVAFQAAVAAFVVAVTYAALARPRWGHIVCAVFAVLITLEILYAGIHPDPHPFFAIEPGAEAVGAVIGRLTVCVLFCVYAYKMVIGTKVRAYFQAARRPVNTG
jgi:hypothetical protein